MLDLSLPFCIYRIKNPKNACKGYYLCKRFGRKKEGRVFKDKIRVCTRCRNRSPRFKH